VLTGSDKLDNSTGAVNIMLIDTDILIDIANRDANAINRLQLESRTQRLAVSAITTMELVVGCRNKQELQILEQFLRKFQVLPLNGTGLFSDDE
jgi:predicted nucleic acid-binding protein